LHSAKNKVKAEEEEEDKEVYSDPEEDGVEIIDMNLVKDMDWSAPDILKRSTKKSSKVKKEAKEGKLKDAKGEDAQIDLANALDLSESEEEEETEDLHDFFARRQDEMDQDRQQARKLYFFQFPSPFPTFELEEQPADVKGKAPEKRVTFTSDTKPPGVNGTGGTQDAGEAEKAGEAAQPKPSGQIGQLEVYASGAVKIRLGNNVLLDVMAATPSSFLQQAVYVDPSSKRMTVLGEVDQRFMVSPNVEQLLEEIERSRLDDVKEMEVDG